MLFGSWLLSSCKFFGSRLFRRSLGSCRLFGSSLFRRRFGSSSLLGSWLFRCRFFGRRLLCCSRLFNSLLGSRFLTSSFFGSWLLSCFRLLCNRLLHLGNFGLLNFLGLFSKLVAASSLLACSSSHLESFSSYTLLQSCSHVYSSFGR